MAEQKSNLKKIILLTAVLIALVAFIVGQHKYQQIFGTAVPKDLSNTTLEIPTNSTFEEVVDLLAAKEIITDKQGFRWVAEYMKYPKPTMRAGRFKIEPGWSNRKLVQHLRAGKQEPVKVVLNHAWKIDQVAGKAAKFIEPDSATIAALLYDKEFLTNLGLSQEEVMTIFIPNTYEFFWNTTPEQFVERMVKEKERFWTKNNRRQKAEDLGLTTTEAYTLASIVERETLQNDEKRRMAGVYYNRITTKGWKLEADPTVKFATGDFGLKRILNKHLAIDSPYNTYKYPGLPPGPISMASISSIDAVLNVESHKYMFFCARGDGSGYHNFAKSLKQHNANAAIYRRNMRKSGAWK